MRPSDEAHGHGVGEAARRPYEKPRLWRIDLAAKEMLGFGCKNPTQNAPSSPSCLAIPCSANGS